jgi:hypothetical protein
MDEHMSGGSLGRPDPDVDGLLHRLSPCGGPPISRRWRRTLPCWAGAQFASGSEEILGDPVREHTSRNHDCQLAKLDVTV